MLEPLLEAPLTEEFYFCFALLCIIIYPFEPVDRYGSEQSYNTLGQWGFHVFLFSTQDVSTL